MRSIFLISACSVVFFAGAAQAFQATVRQVPVAGALTSTQLVRACAAGFADDKSDPAYFHCVTPPIRCNNAGALAASVMSPPNSTQYVQFTYVCPLVPKVPSGPCAPGFHMVPTLVPGPQRCLTTHLTCSKMIASWFPPAAEVAPDKRSVRFKYSCVNH